MKFLFFMMVSALQFISANAQYNEMVYFTNSGGKIKYFHIGDEVSFRLKNDYRLTERKGVLQNLSYEKIAAGKLNFRHEQLLWIRTPLSKGQKFLKTFCGLVLLSAGVGSMVYGYSLFPDNELQKTDYPAFKSSNEEALTIMAAGIPVIGSAIAVFSISGKKYKKNKRWNVQFQR